MKQVEKVWAELSAKPQKVELGIIQDVIQDFKKVWIYLLMQKAQWIEHPKYLMPQKDFMKKQSNKPKI